MTWVVCIALHCIVCQDEVQACYAPDIQKAIFPPPLGTDSPTADAPSFDPPDQMFPPSMSTEEAKRCLIANDLFGAGCVAAYMACGE